MLKDFPDWTLYMENIFLAIYVCLTLISRMNGYFSLVVLLKPFFDTSRRYYADASVLCFKNVEDI